VVSVNDLCVDLSSGGLDGLLSTLYPCQHACRSSSQGSVDFINLNAAHSRGFSSHSGVFHEGTCSKIRFTSKDGRSSRLVPTR